MARVQFCDICKKPTEKISGKLYFTSVKPRQTKKSASNFYEMHLDVGECCKERLLKGFAWRKRMTKDEYNESRKQSA